MSRTRQIIVIADDFTGAAEIGGIGLRHGLKVAIEPEPNFCGDVDLLIVATNTRSMRPEQAAVLMGDISRTVAGFNPLLIYKKVDSALRGNISEELEAQMKAMNLKRSVVIAANPVFKRIIRGGHYFIDNIPLHETAFSGDHQHPIVTNNVLEILNESKKFPVMSRKWQDKLPDSGIIMGDVETLEDLRGWAGKPLSNTLYAGASGFFNSLLMNLKFNSSITIPNTEPFRERALFVLGSAYPKDRQLLDQMIKNGHYHSNMPEQVYYNTPEAERAFNAWVEDIVSGMKTYGKVITSSMHNNISDPKIFIRIKQLMARMVKETLKKVELEEILIEGGSTASAILNALEIKKLTPVQELTVGVIRMRIEGLPGVFLTTKPGSYSWPENVWKQSEIRNMNSKKLMNLASYG